MQPLLTHECVNAYFSQRHTGEMLKVYLTREESCFSTYWQSKDMSRRWKAKPKFLRVMADFLHKGTHRLEDQKQIKNKE